MCPELSKSEGKQPAKTACSSTRNGCFNLTYYIPLDENTLIRRLQVMIPSLHSVVDTQVVAYEITILLMGITLRTLN